jgi:hypothetical protein
VPLWHVWPLPQATHAAPLVPQVELLLGRQVPLLSQQPLGQLVLSQVQTPLTHS